MGRGQANIGADFVNEGLRLSDGSGWVAIGDTNIESETSNKNEQVLVTKIDNNGAIVWSTKIGDAHKTPNKKSYSIGFAIDQDAGFLYVGIGLWKKSSSLQKPAVVALDIGSGNVVWTKMLCSQPKHGGVRGLIVDGQRIICTGYANHPTPGFQFVADGGKAVVWELTTAGNLVKENILNIGGLAQGAKIRKDKTSGYVMTSTAFTEISGSESQAVALVKLSNSLDVEWSKMYGMAGGDSQAFDMLVDNDGNYLMGGHTTVGNGVVNWDYLALKVNSQTKAVMWRKTFGQPRGFNAQYIHDEMYGVALDLAGNYLLLGGGSGDEYTYSATNSAGDSSDVWVSYLVVLDPQGNTLYTNVYGDKAGNNAGEYLALDPNNGDVMVFVDSDTLGGAMGYLKLTPTGSPPTAAPPTTTAAPPTTTTVGPPTPTTTSPTTTTTESEGSEEGSEEGSDEGSEESEECFDIWSENKCWRRKEKGKCNKKWVAKNRQETCEKC